MADETTQFILGDVAVDALGQPRKRRFFQRKKRDERVLTNCENCDAPLNGAYCAQCGQHAIDYHRSLLRVAIDAADSFLNWDTKFLRSIGVLLLWPWRLTNAFNAGRRVRYVHPLRLYLLASIAFFLSLKLVNFGAGHVEFTPETRAQIESALDRIATADNSPLTPEQRGKIEALRTRLGAPPESESSRDRKVMERVAERLPKIAGQPVLKPKDMAKIDALLASVPLPPSPPGQDDGKALPGTPVPPAPPHVTTKLGPTVHFMNNGNGPSSPFERWLETRIKQKVGDDGTNVQLFIDTLRNNIPTMMLCCIPLFALVLKLLYVRQRRYYVEHLVYALHIHTFVYTASVVITLISLGLERWLPSAQQLTCALLGCAAFAMVFVSIRRVYRQGWFLSTLKFLLGAVAYSIVLVLAVGITAFITLVLP